MLIRKKKSLKISIIIIIAIATIIFSNETKLL